ncbi:hypothetical protein F511_16296 [Dorcoceras hygrometricum]|uniref:Uncharacterized protein n=1 Tax=Dorcoceras hygrometricum TaxID=472368 RepID=A0A2Z7AFX2_9LAMI|nr:hypothetical protein F511_16296 [Dorcoceras hygrometricum]
MSSYSAVGLKEQSQESAGSLHPDAREKRRRIGGISSRKLLFISRCYLKIAIAKRCRLHKLIRQCFALALKIQQEEFALLTSRKIQSQATVDPVAMQRFPDAVFETILNEKKLCPTGRNSTEAIYTKAAPLKKCSSVREVGHCEAIAENKSIAQCSSRGKDEEKDEAIDRH